MSEFSPCPNCNNTADHVYRLSDQNDKEVQAECQVSEAGCGFIWNISTGGEEESSRVPEMGRPISEIKWGGEQMTNPKDLSAAATRVPMHLLPSIGAVHGAQACGDGALKYGPYNWREKPITLMQYLGAMERHIAAIKDGEWFCRDAKTVTHLGCLNAGTAIVLDANACKTLIDDRPKVHGGSGAELERFRQSAEEDIT